MSTNQASSYAALRYGGASAARAMAELALPQDRADCLEAVFRKPSAREARYVAAIRALGGFPVAGR